MENNDNPAVEQLNNLVYWYPVLKQIGMRVPKTLIVHRGDCELLALIDGEKPKGVDIFLERLKSATDKIGYPCFLRTGQTSNKHDWKDSCFIRNSKTNLIAHVANLVDHSCMANIAGDPFNYDFWVVREIIPTSPRFNFFDGNLPITRELRFFIRNGKIECCHPYWPDEAFRDKLTEDQKTSLKELQIIPPEDSEVFMMAKYVARYFMGYWSVDFLEDETGKWWCTDMAIGKRSYHYPNCDKVESKD